MLDHALDGYVSAMQCEHRHIEGLLRKLETTLNEGSVHGPTAETIAELVKQLEHLEQALARHFEREEEGGFLEDAMAAAPRFAGEAEELLKEHGDLLAHVRQLARRACERAAREWPTFAASLRNLARQLVSHECRENALLHRSFNVTNGSS